MGVLFDATILRTASERVATFFVVRSGRRSLVEVEVRTNDQINNILAIA